MAHSADLLRSQGTATGRRECRLPGEDFRARRPDIDHLELLCGVVVDILKARSEHLPTSAGPCDLSALRDEMASVIQAGARELAAKLRSELACWTAARANLQQLSRCRYLVLPKNLATVHEELELVSQQAQLVAEALDALGQGRLPQPLNDSKERSGSTWVLQQLGRSEGAEPQLVPGTSHNDTSESEDARSDAQAPQALEVLPLVRPSLANGGNPVGVSRASPVLAQQTLKYGHPSKSREMNANLAPVRDTAAGPRLDGTVEAPESPGVQSVYAQAEGSRDRREYDRAIALYSEILQRAPAHREAYVRRGQLYLIRKQPAQAIKDFSAALRINDRDAESLLYRGDSYAVLRRLDDAVADYSRCLELDAARARARFNRAVAFRLQGQLSKAANELTEVIREQPDHAAAHYNRGLVHTSLELYDQAIADFSKAIELNSAHPHARAKLREARKLLKEKKESRARRPQQAEEYGRPPRKVNPAPDGSVLRVDCPFCGAQGAIRWDKLGHLHVCRRCSRFFRVDPSGSLVEVIRTKDNKWVDGEVHSARSNQARTMRFVIRRLLPVAGLAALLLLSVRVFSRPATTSDMELPRELKPRAELFTQAWLKKDWSRMRLLVKPGEDRNLYKWSVRSPPPIGRSLEGQTEQEIPVDVTVLSIQSQRATVSVQIRDLVGASANGPLDFQQFWEDRDGAWFFMVPAQQTGAKRGR
ncbi:MAG TPA: tetratricopeptide repeat protein [Gemmataceae bacterium]|nr:tetratricopeptide repeat protein [Gemmataceae bacterium]